ncbi:MAG TPA: 2,3-diphosphoglycerate-dependent phosphoglycerate mutase [Gammaproteobacteria bacterium]|nr:2,3-diphosphoglycerate-dependent phosphoglycerate mutase [Gammaproteobacteria bacterium]
MFKIVLIRHGQSEWNLANRFTGWTDVDLSERGRREARSAGRLLKENGYHFDYAFTSVLKRSIRTLWLAQDVMDLMWIPVEKDWRLNERHYGALQGLDKKQTAEQYGAEQVHRWRRGFTVRPPELSDTDPRHPRFDPRYNRLDGDRLPSTESLQDTMARVLEYWDAAIVPRIREGRQVLIVAHGNSLRALSKKLDGISDEAITELNIPTGIPLVYEFDDALEPVRHYYLADAEEVRQAVDEVAHQTPV